MKPDFLNDAEYLKLQSFLADSLLMETVKKTLLSGIYYEGILEGGKLPDPLKNFIVGYFTAPKGGMPALISTQPDAELGAHLRSIINAISLLESSYDTLTRYRQVETEKKADKVQRAK